jgi:hypothetical protein
VHEQLGHGLGLVPEMLDGDNGAHINRAGLAAATRDLFNRSLMNASSNFEGATETDVNLQNGLSTEGVPQIWTLVEEDFQAHRP